MKYLTYLNSQLLKICFQNVELKLKKLNKLYKKLKLLKFWQLLEFVKVWKTVNNGRNNNYTQGTTHKGMFKIEIWMKKIKIYNDGSILIK